jgi:predicted nuclease with TOPRIM domain
MDAEQKIINTSLINSMASPIKHTCPEIDKYIKCIKQAIYKDRDLKNMDEKDLYDAASDMSSELENCIEYLEDLRKSNACLREWGEELDKELQDAATEMDNMEQKINNLV